MFASRLCLPLLLGWALLLGQPAWGTEEEEPPLEKPGEVEQMGSSSSEAREAIRPSLAGLTEDDLADLALDYYNKRDYYDEIFKNVETVSVEYKKAIGNMMYINMLVAKTDCRKEDMRHRSFYSHFNSVQDQPFPELVGCNLPRRHEQENLNCTFGIFIDERSYHNCVASHECKPLRIEERL